MKNLILGIALLGLAVGCKNTDNTAVSDPSTASAPAACESACGTACDKDAAATCDKSATCDKAATCDKSAQTCPVTGKVIEN